MNNYKKKKLSSFRILFLDRESDVTLSLPKSDRESRPLAFMVLTGLQGKKEAFL